MMETIYDVLRELAAAVFTGELGDLAGPAAEIIGQAEQATVASEPSKAKKGA